MKRKFRTIIGIFIPALVLLIFITFFRMMNSEGWVFFVYAVSLFLLVFSAVYLAVWLRESVIKPLDALDKAIRQVGKGDLDYIMDHDAQDEIGKVSEDFEKLRISLKTENEKREQFERENRELISNISHDLKTPLTAIKGYAEGIMDGVVTTPEKLDRYVHTIYAKANDMNTLLDELTYYAKVDTNRIPYHFDKVDPTDFYQDCVEDVGTDLESREILFTGQCELRPGTTMIADVEQMKRVVNNLVNNAVKYMDKTPGQIAIRLLDDGDFIKLEIEDNGCGIAPEDMEAIFDRFYRTDASRNSRKGGSGIGLSIAKKIVEDHGGRIWAKSRPGEGSTFIISLRKYEEEVAHEQDSDRGRRRKHR